MAALRGCSRRLIEVGAGAGSSCVVRGSAVAQKAGGSGGLSVGSVRELERMALLAFQAWSGIAPSGGRAERRC